MEKQIGAYLYTDQTDDFRVFRMRHSITALSHHVIDSDDQLVFTANTRMECLDYIARQSEISFYIQYPGEYKHMVSTEYGDIVDYYMENQTVEGIGLGVKLGDSECTIIQRIGNQNVMLNDCLKESPWKNDSQFCLKTLWEIVKATDTQMQKTWNPNSRITPIADRRVHILQRHDKQFLVEPRFWRLDTRYREPEIISYRRVYTGNLGAGQDVMQVYDSLSNYHPKDYTGTKIKPTDIIIIDGKGGPDIQYIHSLGSRQLDSQFLSWTPVHEQIKAIQEKKQQRKPKIKPDSPER